MSKPVNDHDSKSSHRREKLLGIIQPIVVIFIVLVFAVLATAMVRRQAWLLAVVANDAGFVALGVAGLAIPSLVVMIYQVFASPAQRAGKLAFLLAAIIDAAINLAVIVITLRIDRFALFEEAYFVSVTILLPGVALAGLLTAILWSRQTPWSSAIGFLAWCASLAGGQLWLIAVAFASV